MLKQFLVSILLIILAAPFAYAAKDDIKLDPSAVMFTASEDGKSYTCLEQGKLLIPGSLSKNGKLFKPFKIKVDSQILKLKLRLKKTTDITKKKPLKLKIKALKTSFNKAAKMCRLEHEKSKETPVPKCVITAQDTNLDVIENSTTLADLLPASDCIKPITFEIVSAPQRGKAYVENKLLYYDAPYGEVSDEFLARACHEDPFVCSSNVKVSVKSKKSDFVGKSSSIKAYKEIISAPEAKHLIKKLALNDNNLLADDVKAADGYNLEALINKMLSPESVAPDLKRQLDTYRDGMVQPLKNIYGESFFTPATNFQSASSQVQGLEDFQHYYLKSLNTGSTPYRHFYSNSKTPSAAVLRARYLSATRELINNIWYGHFGVAVHNFGAYSNEYHIRDYMNIIQDNSLGSFKDMIIGINPEACKTEGAGRGILCDPAATLNLSNESNIYNAKNQNFAREFLELFLLGPVDLVTGEPNYNEEDIVAATAFLSGYKTVNYNGTIDSGPSAGTAVVRQKLVWDPARHDFAEYTAFRGKPYEIKGTFTPVEFTEHLFKNHPGLPRFIAGKFFRMLVHRKPSNELVQALADRFKNSNFNIGDLVYAIASSEAMFSKEALIPGCIKEPFRIFTETMRNTNVPLLGTYPVNSGASNHFGHFGVYTADRIRLSMDGMGEKTLLYPTIFSHDYCGRAPEQYGEEWLFSVYMLNRIKAPIISLAQSYWTNSGFFSFSKFLQEVIVAGGSVYDATPSRVIEFYNNLYGVKLDPQEYDIIYEYLTTKLDENDKPVNSGWNPSSTQLIEEKLSGLTAIYASMSQSNVH